MHVGTKVDPPGRGMQPKEGLEQAPEVPEKNESRNQTICSDAAIKLEKKPN